MAEAAGKNVLLFGSYFTEDALPRWLQWPQA